MIQMNTSENDLMLVFKRLIDYLFFFIWGVLILLQKIHTINTSYHNYHIEIDGRNFYDQPINDSIKQNDEIRKISIRQGDYYTTGCLLDLSYFIKKFRLIAVDLSKQKALDAD